MEMSSLLEKPSTVHGVICVFLQIFELSDLKSRDLFKKNFNNSSFRYSFLIEINLF